MPQMALRGLLNILVVEKSLLILENSINSIRCNASGKQLNFFLHYISILPMGAQICSHNNQWSSHRQDVTPSSYMEPLSMPEPQSHDDDDLMEEFDNPTRGIQDHNFLKTNFTASSRTMREEKVKINRQDSNKKIFFDQKSLSQNQPPSIYRLESSQLSIGKDQWAEVFRFDTSEAAETQNRDDNNHRPRKVSVQSRMVSEGGASSDSSGQNDNILRQVSGYMLSQKNLFEPLAINKEQFVRFRKEQIEKHYSFVEKIGEGSFGNVFKVYHKATQEMRAIKILKKSAVSKLEAHKILKEADILKKLDHPHIVKIYEVFFYHNNYYIVTQHCEGGSLCKLFKENVHVSIETIRIIFKQLISALSYIHQLGVIHRDIKLDNILLMNKSCDPKDIDIRLIDFGLAKELKVKRLKDREMVGTHTYMAPEVIEGIYSTKCDMWSAGIVLLNMIGRKNPFKGRSKEETLEKIKKDKINFSGDRWSGIGVQIKELIIGLLDKDSRVRLGSEQVLASKWLSEERDDEDYPELMNLVSRKFYDYYRSNNFVSVIESYIAYTTTTENEFKLFSRCFQLLDENKDGFIETKQLQRAFKSSTDDFSMEEIKYVLSKVDNEHKGRINFTQFVTKLSNRSKLFARPSLVQAFDYLDDNSNGYLQRAELKKVLKNMDCSQLSFIIEELDQNQDDRISLEEFISYLNKEQSSA